VCQEYWDTVVKEEQVRIAPIQNSSPRFLHGFPALGWKIDCLQVPCPISPPSTTSVYLPVELGRA